MPPDHVSAASELFAHTTDHKLTPDEKQLGAPPRLQLVIVTCMDSRIQLFDLLDINKGDAQILRNAGGVITDDVLRSLMISQRLLGTKSVMLIQHTDCGLLNCDEHRLQEEIYADVGTKPPWALEAFTDLDDNVNQSLRRIALCPFLPHKDDVRGFVYDVHTGKLREVRSS